MTHQIIKRTVTMFAIAATLGAATAPAHAYTWSSEQKKHLAFALATGVGWNQWLGFNGVTRTWEAQASWYGSNYSQVIVKACGLSDWGLSNVPYFSPHNSIVGGASYMKLGGSPGSRCPSGYWDPTSIGNAYTALRVSETNLRYSSSTKADFYQSAKYAYTSRLNDANSMRWSYQSKYNAMKDAEFHKGLMCSRYPGSSSCTSANISLSGKKADFYHHKNAVKSKFVRAAEHLRNGANTLQSGYLPQLTVY